MNVRWSLALPLTAIALAFVATPTGAVPVTSGFVSGSVNSDFAANIDLAGDGFSLRGFDPIRGPGIQPTSFVPDPWAARRGDPVDLSSRVLGGHPDSLPVLTWQGTSSRATVDFLFTSPTVVKTFEQGTLTVPFTFTGSVTALTGQTLSLTGQGITSAIYEADLRRIRFDFASPLSFAPSLDLATVAAMPPTLLNALQDCGMCATMRDLGVMASGSRGVEVTPLSGGFLSGPVVMEMDSVGGPARLVNPEPTTAVLLLTGALLLILQAARGKNSSFGPKM
jgi:hypothetical protein